MELSMEPPSLALLMRFSQRISIDPKARDDDPHKRPLMWSVWLSHFSADDLPPPRSQYHYDYLTVITNLGIIAEELNTLPAVLVEFIARKLGIGFSINERSLTGGFLVHLHPIDVQRVVDLYIEEFVLCQACRSPFHVSRYTKAGIRKRLCMKCTHRTEDPPALRPRRMNPFQPHKCRPQRRRRQGT